jgi:predicted nucleic acid-binding protein
LHSRPTAELAAEALELALAFELSAYDASYAALARRLELPLLTADAALANKLENTKITCIPLDNLELPD